MKKVLAKVLMWGFVSCLSLGVSPLLDYRLPKTPEETQITEERTIPNIPINPSKVIDGDKDFD